MTAESKKNGLVRVLKKGVSIIWKILPTGRKTIPNPATRCSVLPSKEVICSGTPGK
jgi:hypothetical protein